MSGIAAGSSALLGAALGWWSLPIVVIVMLILAMIGKRPPLAVWAVALVATGLGAWRESSIPEHSLAVDASLKIDLGVVATSPVRSDQTQYFVLAPVEQRNSQEAVGNARYCVVAPSMPKARFGDHVRLDGQAIAARDVSIARRAYLERRGCAASVFATSLQIVSSTSSVTRTLADIQEKLGETLRTIAPGDEGALMNGLVTGDDAGLSTSREEAFLRTGTTHLTAVSGSNLALVAGILAAIGAATWGRYRMGWQMVAIGGVWLYALVSGSQAPAVRAALVATAAILAFRAGRGPDFPTLILIAAGSMVLIQPAQIDALGFRLSVAASLALACVLPRFAQAGAGRAIAGVLAATAAAQIATLPFILSVFGTVSLLSIPANLLVAPLAALAMPLAGIAAVAGVIWLPLGEAIGAPATLVARAMLAVVDLMSAPAAYIQVGIPPPMAAILAGLGSAGLLLGLSSDVTRIASRFTSKPLPARGPGAAIVERGAARLAPAAAPILRGEQPADASAADANDAIEDPSREEDRHQVAEKR